MKNNFKIYLDIGGSTVKIPVLPQELSVKYPTEHETYSVLDTGGIIIPQSPSLKEISWESYFPGNKGDGLLMGNSWKSPGYYVEKLEGAMNGKSVVDLVICRYDAAGKSVYETNVSAVITDFTATDKGGEAGDVYYSISLSEYRDYKPIVLSLPAAGEAAVQGVQERPVTGGKLYVGAKVIANGTYYASSYGDKPTGRANNLATTVTRIINDPGRPYPILIGGGRGWTCESRLQVTGS